MRNGRRKRWMVVLALPVLMACQPPAPAPQRVVQPPAPAPACVPQTPEIDGQAVDRMRAAILGLLAPQPGLRVGDVGVGGGWFAQRVAERVGNTGAVFGTDIDAATLTALRQAPPLGPQAAPLRYTLAVGEAQSGLEDLPDNSLDLLMLIDSLCFDQRLPQPTHVAYLRGLLRVLKPGGRLVHHMDCTCRTRVAQVEALFQTAGFTLPPARTELPCATLAAAACPDGEAQERARFVGVFGIAR